MKGNNDVLCKELLKIKKLDADIYSKLLNTYGEELVNKTIEQLIDENSKNLSKFDYYISKIISYDDDVTKSTYELYGMDLNNFPCLSNEENAVLMKEIFLMVTRLNTLVNEIAYECNMLDCVDKTWLVDRVELCIRDCSSFNNEKISELKKLYSQFIRKRNVVAEGNLRWVISISKKYHINATVFTEAIQYGNMGLLRAIEKYDSSFNVTFATYAYYWIRQCITRNIHEVIYPVSIPMQKVRDYSQMKKVIRQFEHENGRTPTNLEIANEMNIDVEKVDLLKRTFNEGISLYENVAGKDDDESILLDFIVDENASVTKEVFEGVVREEIMNILNSCLTEKERKVIERRFGFYNGRIMKLEEIGNEFGVTREWIRQIENKSLRKLKYKVKDFEGYLD